MTQNDNKNNNPLVPAVLGAIVGAGAVLAANKDNRDAIKKKYNELRQTGEDKLDEARDKVSEMGQKSKKKISEALGSAEDKLNEANQQAQKTVYKSKRRLNEV
jgi:gas vesicle protein